jgi:hypothetical protein
VAPLLPASDEERDSGAALFGVSAALSGVASAALDAVALLTSAEALPRPESVRAFLAACCELAESCESAVAAPCEDVKLDAAPTSGSHCAIKRSQTATTALCGRSEQSNRRLSECDLRVDSAFGCAYFSVSGQFAHSAANLRRLQLLQRQSGALDGGQLTEQHRHRTLRRTVRTRTAMVGPCNVRCCLSVQHERRRDQAQKTSFDCVFNGFLFDCAVAKALLLLAADDDDHLPPAAQET